MLRKLLLLACLWPAITLGLGPNRPSLRLGLASIDRQILASQPALWLDGLKTSSLTSAADGTISAWLDKSGGGYDFAQGTAANKPFLTRSDNLENRYLQSNNLQTSWTTNNVSPNSATRLNETAATGEHHVSQLVEVVKGASYTHSVSAKAIDDRWGIALRIRGSGFKLAYFDLQNGVMGTVEAGATASIEPDTVRGAGWYKCSMTWTADASAIPAQVIYIASADSTASYAGDVDKGVYLADMHFARTGKGYVTTSTYPVYAGLNGRAVPYFPNAATYMSRAFTAALDIGVGDNTIFAVVGQDGGVDAAAHYILDTETRNTKGTAWMLTDTTGYSVFIASTDGGNSALVGATAPSAGELKLRAIRKGTGLNQTYINGAADGSDTAITSAVSASANAFNIGAKLDATGGLRGYYPELLVFGRALGGYELGRITSLIKRRERM